MIRRSAFVLALIVILGAIIVTGGKQDAYTRLVAVSEGGNMTTGSIADLFLEIKPGSGRVFLETLPASKLDTQMSMRLAKNIACKYADADCSKYDFFYTIHADSAIVGGPSATAAAAVVTIAVLEDIDLRDDVVITGIITSGDLIGNVGGLPEKIRSAAQANITTLLIPLGQRMHLPPGAGAVLPSENTSVDLTRFGEALGIAVVEVGTLDDALEHFTGIPSRHRDRKLKADEGYQQTMQYLAERLCNRSDLLDQSLDAARAKRHAVFTDEDHTIKESAENLTRRAMESKEARSYYSMASFCFGAGVNYHHLLLIAQQPGRLELLAKKKALESSMTETEHVVDEYPIRTITDLQTFMVVKARLMEAKEHLDLAQEALERNDERASAPHLAFATERANSALAWSTFFGRPGRRFKMSAEDLARGCAEKLHETEEHYQYMELMFPTLLEDVREDLDLAQRFKDQEEYVMCLYQATITKARINVFASVVGVGQEEIPALLERKLLAAQRMIAEQQEEDIFPILGYSYYEYAGELADSAPFSSLLYAEYALELGNLDIYFESEKTLSVGIVQRKWVLVFLAGLTLGFLISEGLGHWPGHKERQTKKRISRKREEKGRAKGSRMSQENPSKALPKGRLVGEKEVIGNPSRSRKRVPASAGEKR